MKEPQRLAVAKLREKDVGDYLDLTAHATLIALAVPGTSWRGSRDGLLKKLEVGSIVGALLGAICLTVILQPLSPGPVPLLGWLLPCPAPVATVVAHLYYICAVAGALSCLACVLRAVLLQAHLVMHTPTCAAYIEFLYQWEFDAVDLFLVRGIQALCMCLPCGVAIVGNLPLAAVTALAVWWFLVDLWRTWQSMLGHNNAVLFAKEKELLEAAGEEGEGDEDDEDDNEDDSEEQDGRRRARGRGR
eukprot:g4809.t1